MRTQPRDIFKLHGAASGESKGATTLLRAIEGHPVYMQLENFTISRLVEAALSSDGIVTTHTRKTVKTVVTVTWCVQACVATFKLSRGVSWKYIGLEHMVANVYMALRNSCFQTRTEATDDFYARGIKFLTATYGDGMDSVETAPSIAASAAKDSSDKPKSRAAARHRHGNELIRAVEAGSLRRAKELLSMPSINLEETDINGYTPLIIAAYHNRVDFVRLLLRAGADVFAATDDGHTALAASVKNRNLATTHMLVRAGADANVRYVDGMFPLYRAIWDQNKAIATLLVKAGADYHMPYENGETPLHLAASIGNTKIVVMLIDAGVDVNVRMIGGYTALHRATQCGHGAVVTALMKAGADPSLGYSDGDVVLVALDFAVGYQDVSVVKELLVRGGLQRCWGKSKGLNALRYATRVSSLPIAKLLIDAGVVDDGGALMIAVNNADQACVALLLRAWRVCQQPKYPNVTISEDLHGISAREGSVTPLTLAIRQFGKHSSPKIAQGLVECGADTSMGVYVTHGNGKPDEMMTPLQLVDQLSLPETCRDEGSRARLAAMGRLLHRAAAIRACSWLWPLRDSPSATMPPPGSVEGEGPHEATRIMLQNMRRRVLTRRLPVVLQLHEASVVAAE